MIRRVVYIEPYPKSLASMLHLDAIVTEAAPVGASQVEFAPFVGVAPRRYMELFTMPRRKTDDGIAVAWKASTALPRLPEIDSTYLVREREEVAALHDILTSNPAAFGKRRNGAKRRMARQGFRKR